MYLGMNLEKIKSLTKFKMGLAVLLVLLLVPGMISAQENENSKGSESVTGMDSAQNQDLANAKNELNNVQKKLRDIQQQAIQKNPQIKKDQKELRELVQTKIEEYSSGADRQRLKEISKELKGKDLRSKENRPLIKEFMKIRQKLRQAQQKAMQDKEVQKMQKQVEKKLKVAMNKVDPAAEDLIKKWEELQQKVQQLQFKAQQSKKVQPKSE